MVMHIRSWLSQNLYSWASGPIHWLDPLTMVSLLCNLLYELPRKVSFISPMLLCSLMIYRILIICIQYLSQFPCSQCCIQLHEISQLGGKLDQKCQQTRLRVDNAQRHQRIEQACKLIFVKEYGVESESIKTLLKERSLTSLKVQKSIFSKCPSITFFL